MKYTERKALSDRLDAVILNCMNKAQDEAYMIDNWNSRTKEFGVAAIGAVAYAYAMDVIGWDEYFTITHMLKGCPLFHCDGQED